jgi:HK97 family phage major capsid protein
MENSKELLDKIQAEVGVLLATEKRATESEIKSLQDQLETLKTSMEKYPEVKAEVERLATELNALKEQPTQKTTQKTLKEYIVENSQVLKRIKENAKKRLKDDGFSFTVEKATQGAGDFSGRDYWGTVENDTERKPVRRPSILSLFRRQPVSSEYLHYREENVVTRDAKFVVACATSTHNTKKTWIKRTVELAKIRDIVDICIDMMEDYTFVEGEIRELVTESIQLKAEYDLLLGTVAAPTDMLSINHISSEFNPANVLADYSNAFQAPTIGDLTAAMKAQIYTFGQENKWMADTIIMNYNDMIKYLHAKDQDDNYLFPTFVFGTTDTINGMRIVTSPIVAENTIYVFDSTKGKILDRQSLTVTMSYENRDNIEHEIVTVVAVERLQFYVRNINKDAFMKCSDITTALAAIKKT